MLAECTYKSSIIRAGARLNQQRIFVPKLGCFKGVILITRFQSYNTNELCLFRGGRSLKIKFVFGSLLVCLCLRGFVELLQVLP